MFPSYPPINPVSCSLQPADRDALLGGMLLKFLGLQWMGVSAALPLFWAGFYEQKALVIAFNEDLNPVHILKC